MLQYQRAQVESASPTRLIVLLYEGAIRFCHMARAAMLRGDLETQNLNLVRAQRIVGELIASLDRNAGGEVAARLSNIYAHVLEELVAANLYDRTDKVDHVIALLTEMRASWVEIDRMAAGDCTLSDAAPVPIGPAPSNGQAGRSAADAVSRPVAPRASGQAVGSRPVAEPAPVPATTRPSGESIPARPSPAAARAATIAALRIALADSRAEARSGDRVA
jgi:flagellar protein FliS